MNKGEGKKNGLHLHFSYCLSAILKECHVIPSEGSEKMVGSSSMQNC